jgi:hypothetical protein
MANTERLTLEFIEGILDRLAEGETLAALGREHGFSRIGFHKALNRHADRASKEDGESLRLAYARARESGVEHLLDECLAIADDTADDYTEKTRADGSKYEQFNPEAVQRSKLKIDTRFKLAAVIAPHKYGDKLDVTSKGEKLPDGAQVAPEEVASRIASVLAMAQKRQARGLKPNE